MRSPALKKNPSQRLLDQIREKPTADLLKHCLEDRLGSTFPKRADLIGEMKLEFAFKGVAYETLTTPTVQEGVRKAYARGDFDKPFYDV
jgi:hypothetical protein